MFGSSFSSMLSKLKQNKIMHNIAANITEKYAKIKDSISIGQSILEIAPNIYHIPYPERQNIDALKLHIDSSEFQIWNLSQYKYSKEIENQILGNQDIGQTFHLCYTLYSNIPFYELVLAINTIHNFIKAKPTNKVYVHCQQNKMRSAVLLSCYIYKHKTNGIDDISQAILHVNKLLKITIQDKAAKNTYQNQHTIFKNFVNYLNTKEVINYHKLHLLKVIINNAPLIKIGSVEILERSPSMKVGIDIKCGEDYVYKNTYEGNIFQGNSLCLKFDQKVIILQDQFLIIFKYIYDGMIYNIFRIQLNTNFIYQHFTRVHSHSLDLSSFCVVDPVNIMHVDFMFQEGAGLSRLAQLKEQSVTQFKSNHQSNPVNQALKAAQKQQVKLNLQKQHKEQAIAILNDSTGQTQEEEQEINMKVQAAIKAININKQIKDENQQQEQQDLQDYLSKLESLA